jgi:hypothetical protein
VDPTHSSMPRTLGPSCALCCRQWRDLAGAQLSCFSPKGKYQRDTHMAGAWKGRGLKKGE